MLSKSLQRPTGRVPAGRCFAVNPSCKKGFHIPIPTDQYIRHPVGCPAHNGGYGFDRYVLAAFNNQFIMDMTADEAVGQVLHCEAEKVPADGLNDVFNELRTV